MTTMELPGNAEPGFVYVPVPVPLLDRVYALLAEARPEPEAGPKEGEEFTPELNRQGVLNLDQIWTEERLRRLTASRQESVRRTVELLDVMARHPGRAVSLSLLSTESGYDRMQIRGALSGFKRLVDGLLEDIGNPRLEDTRPFHVHWQRVDAEEEHPGMEAGQQGERTYRMSVAIARRWRSVRGLGKGEE